MGSKPAFTPRRPSATQPRASGTVLAPPAGDIRSVRPYILSRGRIRSTARRAASIVALIALDLGGLALGLYAALVVREVVYGHVPILWGVLWEGPSEWLPFLTVITVLVFWRAGLYAPRELRPGVGTIASSLVLVALIALAFGLGTDHEFSTFGLFPTAFVLTTVLIGVFRASYESLTGELLRITGVRRRAVLVGEGERVNELQRALGSGRGGIDYEFVGALASEGEGIVLPVLGPHDGLPAVLAEHDVDELIMSDADFDEETLLEVVEQAHRHGVQVRVAPKTTELLFARGEYVPGHAVPLFELRPPVLAGADWAVKRAFDVAVSVLVIVLGLPLWIAIALAIKLTSPGPVLYRDRRVGLNEREFEMLKFRTMVAGADARQVELEAENVAAGALFKIRRDPRVTGVGRVLRRFSLDEIPQVLNVLRGEMSLVGPRPLPVRDYARLEPWHRKRYFVLPGMTGLWQIAGRSDLSFDDLVRLDFYYLDNWSVWLDVSILAKTIPAVLRRRGAY